jgi:hypothetical protein
LPAKNEIAPVEKRRLQKTQNFALDKEEKPSDQSKEANSPKERSHISQRKKTRG